MFHKWLSALWWICDKAFVDGSYVKLNRQILQDRKSHKWNSLTGEFKVPLLKHSWRERKFCEWQNKPQHTCYILKQHLVESQCNLPPSAEWMMTTLLNGPSPLLLYTPTFTSNGVRGGKVSSLYLYIVASAEVTIFSFQPLVPLARNATMYPKPSPFWNSSDIGWKHLKRATMQIKNKLLYQNFIVARKLFWILMYLFLIC